MSQTGTVNKTSPVGRIVWGDLYKPNDKDFQGNPRLIKSGPNAGKTMLTYDFGVAFPKTRAGWWEEDWGAAIYAEGYRAFPQAAQRPDFAWKVTDGDSLIPNKAGKIPAQQTGYKGCWVVRFSSMFPPTLCTLIDQPPGSPKQLGDTPGMIVPGYYVQVNFDVAGNETPANPGVFVNHRIVCLMGYGERIQSGPDISAAGFGQGTSLPPGATTVPPAGFAPAPAMAPAPAAAPASAPPPAPAPSAAPASAPAPAPAPAPVPAHPAMTSAPPPPAAPVAPAGPQMTAKATTSYDAYRQAGWTDEQLRQNGLMV